MLICVCVCLCVNLYVCACACACVCACVHVFVCVCLYSGGSRKLLRGVLNRLRTVHGKNIYIFFQCATPTFGKPRLPEG